MAEQEMALQMGEAGDDEKKEEYAPLQQAANDVPLDKMRSKGASILSVSHGRSPKGGEIDENNLIEQIRRRASRAKEARIDNSDLLHRPPTIQDLFYDNRAGLITMTQALLLCVALALFIFALEEGHTSISVVLLGCIAMAANLFGIVVSMYSGSMTRKAHMLDTALQKLASIFQHFARALDIQEEYLNDTKKKLNDFDRSLCFRLGAIRRGLEENLPLTTEVLAKWSGVEATLNYQVVEDQVAWIGAFFDQFQLLDTRLGITRKEYDEFVEQLPDRSKELFQNLQGVDQRFKLIEDGTKEIQVLLYDDMYALMEKVLGDLEKQKSQIQKPADSMQPTTPKKGIEGPRGSLLRRRMSAQMTDTGNPLIGQLVRRVSQKDLEDSIPDSLLENALDVLNEDAATAPSPGDFKPGDAKRDSVKL